MRRSVLSVSHSGRLESAATPLWELHFVLSTINFSVLNYISLPENMLNKNSNHSLTSIKSRLKLGNACYYSVQNLLSSSLLSKNIKIKIYRTTILPVVLYGCETWSLTFREELRLRVFENRVLRRVFGPKMDEVTGNGQNYIMRSLAICTPYPTLCGW